ncbi:CYTH domain-containing protein [Metabacillus sp. HB246100]
MSQEIEIEFKNILTREEFYRIKSHFQLREEQFFMQENHYFDTLTFSLKERGSALRIRKKKNGYVITLKEPAPVGILETHQIVSETEALKMIECGGLLQGEISERLLQVGISDKDLLYFGTLTTNRAEINYKDGLLVFDHSMYLSTEDYEMEYEVTNEERGKKIFLTLCEELKIPIRDTKNKIRRFYEQKQKSFQ